MTPEILAWLAETHRRHFPQPGVVLELGSLNVNGSARDVIQNATRYTGIDMRAGAGADYVLHSKDLVSFCGKETVDTVLCLETLEHDLRFWETVSNLRAVLKRGGVLVISTPTVGFPHHPFPRDYYRFTEDTYTELFFAGMQLLRLTTLNSAAGAGTTIARVARK